MKLLLRYLVSKRPLFLYCALCAGLLLLSFSLYELPMQGVVYPICLCAVLGVLFLLADFLRTLRRHRRVQQRRSLSLELMEALPKPQTVAEADDQALLSELYRAQQDFAQAAEARYQGMMDYYTVWVHQIKTPIAAMRLSLQNEDTPFSRRQQAELSRIEQYVNMVLTYLRLDSDSTDYTIRRISLDRVVHTAVKKLAGSFIEKKLQLCYTELRREVLTDEKWLLFVLEQLLSNAVKYTPAGSISIFMEGDCLAIRDTGIGIASEDLPRVFENGFTGFNGRTDTRASGIGLYLCRRICDNLGHSLRICSTVGEGTTVYLGFSERQM